jgi:hypothetical protein
LVVSIVIVHPPVEIALQHDRRRYLVSHISSPAATDSTLDQGILRGNGRVPLVLEQNR